MNTFLTSGFRSEVELWRFSSRAGKNARKRQHVATRSLKHGFLVLSGCLSLIAGLVIKLLYIKFSQKYSLRYWTNKTTIRSVRQSRSWSGTSLVKMYAHSGRFLTLSQMRLAAGTVDDDSRLFVDVLLFGSRVASRDNTSDQSSS